MIRFPRSAHNAKDRRTRLRTGSAVCSRGDSDIYARHALLVATTPLLALTLASCAGAPEGDTAQILRATLALLETGRSPNAPQLCVDSRPRGEPLAIYRTMRINSEPDEHQWREAEPLRTEPKVHGRDLFNDATGRETLRIREPDEAAEPLPREAQAQLDARARAMSVDGESLGFAMDGSLAPANMAVRWWLMNRLHGCERTVVLSRLVHDGKTGFITATLDHWGTTYALERSGAGWRVAAQWDTWLY
ncbi:hypothetical protein GCM10011380_14440 [Sphingomonas metalli]|uniref:Uncharacterized protein n=1 Tax=Sphingomonas metalli TaxID=1779358 RepID=A0A916T0U9_9SPHN|nr:hypothetical protein [Sphingomonas metalli]GGB25966.1 hypothetical protein GCM10011380_14440 [Sphingomonas metalli]